MGPAKWRCNGEICTIGLVNYGNTGLHSLTSPITNLFEAPLKKKGSVKAIQAKPIKECNFYQPNCQRMIKNDNT